MRRQSWMWQAAIRTSRRSRTSTRKAVVHGTLGVGASSVEKQGREIVEQGFAILERQIAGHGYAVGDTFGIADAALFYVERWAPQRKIALPPNLAAHLDRVKARPAVQRVMKVWGEA